MICIACLVHFVRDEMFQIFEHLLILIVMQFPFDILNSV